MGNPWAISGQSVAISGNQAPRLRLGLHLLDGQRALALADQVALAAHKQRRHRCGRARRAHTRARTTECPPSARHT
eukprot:160530-Prymnesium_polylepis.1